MRLVNIFLDYLWALGFQQCHKFKVINWITLCAPISHGSLIIRDFIVLYKVKGAKWVRDLLSSQCQAWQKAIHNKYLNCLHPKSFVYHLYVKILV
jgi:hypothetical protein